MQRETRLNLVWIAVLVGLMLPGAVTIFRKKFKPGEQPMSFREPVRTSAVFMDPSGFPAEFQRVVPRRTAEWVSTLLRDELGAGTEMLLVERGGVRTPVVSTSRRVQLAGWSATESRRALLVVWDEAPIEDVSVTGEDFSPLLPTRRRAVLLPREVSIELRDAGYIRPPKQVTLLVIDVPAEWSRLLVRTGASSDLLELPPGH